MCNSVHNTYIPYKNFKHTDTNPQTDRQTDRQSDRHPHTDTHTNRHTYTHPHSVTQTHTLNTEVYCYTVPLKVLP